MAQQQQRYSNCTTLSRSYQKYMKERNNAGVIIHDIHEILGTTKLILTPKKFILSYKTVEGKLVKHEASYNNPYLHNGENNINIPKCHFSMMDKGKDYFREIQREKLISNGWKEDEFLTYDDSDEVEIDIEPETEDAGKPITLRTVFTNDNHFGTRYLWQRIYFYVGDDEFPFFQMNFNTSINEQTQHELRL